MKNKIINLAHLYPDEMNIYGDTGNRIILMSRLKRRGYAVKIHLVGLSQQIPRDIDLIIGGGGQDAGQVKVQDSLLKHKNQLSKMAAEGVTMLMVCGLYQLFGRRFVTVNGQEIKGIGLLPLETLAGHKRLIGNTLYRYGNDEVVGYENHSGLTKLDDPKTALWHVIKGAGNNNEDGTEGCKVGNVFGTYAHGPVLSKNPVFADDLLASVISRKYPEDHLAPLDDDLENQAAAIAKTRPR